jgi:hypothetical protein
MTIAIATKSEATKTAIAEGSGGGATHNVGEIDNRPPATSQPVRWPTENHAGWWFCYAASLTGPRLYGRTSNWTATTSWRRRRWSGAAGPAGEAVQHGNGVRRACPGGRPPSGSWFRW